MGKIFQGIHFSQLWSHQSTWVGNTTTIAFSALFVQKIAESAVAPAAAMGELQQFEKRIPREILPHFDRWTIFDSQKIRKLWSKKQKIRFLAQNFDREAKIEKCWPRMHKKNFDAGRAQIL